MTGAAPGDPEIGSQCPVPRPSGPASSTPYSVTRYRCPKGALGVRVQCLQGLGPLKGPGDLSLPPGSLRPPFSVLVSGTKRGVRPGAPTPSSSFSPQRRLGVGPPARSGASWDPALSPSLGSAPGDPGTRPLGVSASQKHKGHRNVNVIAGGTRPPSHPLYTPSCRQGTGSEPVPPKFEGSPEPLSPKTPPYPPPP